MPRRARMQLAKPRELIERQVVAREMQQGIEQHRSMPIREHEAITIRPRRIRRVVSQMAAPKHRCDFRHAHRHAGMAGLRFLHSIYREHAQAAVACHAGSLAGDLFAQAVCAGRVRAACLGAVSCRPSVPEGLTLRTPLSSREAAR